MTFHPGTPMATPANIMVVCERLANEIGAEINLHVSGQTLTIDIRTRDGYTAQTRMGADEACDATRELLIQRLGLLGRLRLPLDVPVRYGASHPDPLARRAGESIIEDTLRVQSAEIERLTAERDQLRRDIATYIGARDTERRRANDLADKCGETQEQLNDAHASVGRLTAEGEKLRKQLAALTPTKRKPGVW